MDVIESLVGELTLRITEIDNQLYDINIKQISELKLIVEKLLNKINTVKLQKKEGKQIDKTSRINREDIINLNSYTILELFPDFDKVILDKLQIYTNKLWGLFFNQHSDEVLNNLTLISTTLLEKLLEKEKNVNFLLEEKDNLRRLINSLEKNIENIFDKDIDDIIEFLKKNSKNEQEILQCVRDLIVEVEKKINEMPNVEKINFENEENVEILSENLEDIEVIKIGIIKILKDNGYDNIVSYFEQDNCSEKIKNAKEKLFKYGKLDNIEQIVKTLKKYNIDLLEQMESNFYKLIMMFLYSSKENLETIFNLALEPEICICKYKDDGSLLLDENNNPQINFTLLLERESRFISKKKRYRKRGNETIEIDVESQNIGTIENYVQNIRFFQNVLGVDIKELFSKMSKQNNVDNDNVKDGNKKNREKVGSYFDVPHDKVLRNKAVFDLYEIPIEAYNSTLTSLMATNPEDTIDRYIELDIFDFLKENMSLVNKKPDNPSFYRIARTYQLSEILPNPDNLPLHVNARQFLFSHWKNGIPVGQKRYIYAPETIDFNDLKTIHVGNSQILFELEPRLKDIQLDTEINKQNGSIVTKQYKREDVLTTEQLYNFDCFDALVNDKDIDNVSIDKIGVNPYIIKRLNHIGANNMGIFEKDFFIFGRIPDEIRISKWKFYRIYNTLLKKGYHLKNDRDCVLYALTYNSIMTSEQFELIKAIVNNIFRFIPNKEERLVEEIGRVPKKM